MSILFKATIPGRVPVKKNTARHYKNVVVYSKPYREWATMATGIIKLIGINTLITQYCEARFVFYLKNSQWEPDISNVCEGPQDILETCHILDNDRLIKRLLAEKHFDKDNPRLEIELHSL